MQSSETNYYSSLFLASRPKTLLASVLPVVLGSHLAFTQSSSINIVLLSSIVPSPPMPDPIETPNLLRSVFLRSIFEST